MIIWVCSCGIMKFSGPTLPKLGLRESSVEPCRMHIIGSMAGFWVRRMLNPATEVQAQGISWAALRDKVTAQPVPTTQWPACNSGGCRCAPGHCWKKHFKACLQSGLNGLSILVIGFFMSCKILKIHIVVISPYKIIVYIRHYTTICYDRSCPKKCAITWGFPHVARLACHPGCQGCAGQIQPLAMVFQFILGDMLYPLVNGLWKITIFHR